MPPGAGGMMPPCAGRNPLMDAILARTLPGDTKMEDLARMMGGMGI